jgi:hypothetical protein
MGFMRKKGRKCEWLAMTGGGWREKRLAYANRMALELGPLGMEYVKDE